MLREEFIESCKEQIIEVVKVDYHDVLTKDDLHVVWQAKVLQNHKCVLVDLKPNNRYYECTYNGDKKELYLDIYIKDYNYRYVEETAK
jgi:hypothetical protein